MTDGAFSNTLVYDGREKMVLASGDYLFRCGYEDDENGGAALKKQTALADYTPLTLTITGITRYLQEHLSEELSLSVLAGHFHLNAQYISQLFKNEIGVGFLTYLTNIRMEKAKKLLVSTSLSVTEIAGQVGYGDYRVFTKAFKKSEGTTPSQYRRDFLIEENEGK